MDKEYLLQKWNNPEIKSIYGFMYGHAFINGGGINGDYWRADKIIEIPKEHLQLSINQDCLVYTWGWPGPDCNFYEFDDYGKTWVFADRRLEKEEE